jgi:hypothetical protein
MLSVSLLSRKGFFPFKPLQALPKADVIRQQTVPSETNCKVDNVAFGPKY